MKILNAIHSQSIGGMDQMFRNYSQVLANSNHEVFLLISKCKDNDYKGLGAKKIFKLRNISPVFDLSKLFWILWIYKIDIIICHSMRHMRWMALLKYFVKTKIVAVNHGISFKKSLNCEYIININQQIAQMVENQGFDPKKNFVLANAIAIDEKYKEKQINKIPAIGIYGRLERRKGFDILIEACAILQQKNIDFKLKIGGFEVDGYSWDSIKSLAKSLNIIEKCQFVGIVKDKKDFFNNVDIFCVPSREEPFGLVILDSFANSCLVISSNSEGGKLLINDNQDGLLFENENAANLAEKIILALNLKENYCQFTKKAYKKLQDQFSFNAMIKQLDEILLKIENN